MVEEILTFDAQLTSLQAGQYAIVNFGDLDLEVALDTFNPSARFTLTYPLSGNLAIPVRTFKNGFSTDVTLRLTMVSATRTEIDPENNSIDLAPWPSSE